MAGGIHDAEDSWATHGIKPGHPAYNALVMGHAQGVAPSTMDVMFTACAFLAEDDEDDKKPKDDVDPSALAPFASDPAGDQMDGGDGMGDEDTPTEGAPGVGDDPDASPDEQAAPGQVPGADPTAPQGKPGDDPMAAPPGEAPAVAPEAPGEQPEDPMQAAAPTDGGATGAPGAPQGAPMDKVGALRAIQKSGKPQPVDGAPVDAFTASAIVQVYDALNPENQQRFQTMPIHKMADIAFKLLGKAGGRIAPVKGAQVQDQLPAKPGAAPPPGGPGAQPPAPGAPPAVAPGAPKPDAKAPPFGDKADSPDDADPAAPSDDAPDAPDAPDAAAPDDSDDSDEEDDAPPADGKKKNPFAGNAASTDLDDAIEKARALLANSRKNIAENKKDCYSEEEQAMNAAPFEEAKHPRDAGKFASAPGAGAKPDAAPAPEKKPYEKAVRSPDQRALGSDFPKEAAWKGEKAETKQALTAAPAPAKWLHPQEMASVIKRDWKNVAPEARPYVSALSDMDDWEHGLMADSGRVIAAYALGNLTSWKGPVARQVKEQLKQVAKGVYKAKTPVAGPTAKELAGSKGGGAGRLIPEPKNDRDYWGNPHSRE